MDRQTEAENSNKIDSKVIKTALNGLLRLEYYQELGYVVTIKISEGKYFYCQLAELSEIIEEFQYIVKAKHGHKAKTSNKRKSNSKSII